MPAGESDHGPATLAAPPRASLLPFAVLLAALLLSGLAGLVNQVVWQRALKLYLGGSEALSTMTVVLVFMLGLGVGSLLASRRTARMRNPAAVLVLLEALLLVVNLLIAVLLRLDLSETVYGFQRVAISAGVPIRVVYFAAATLLLTPPCLMMGMTLPVGSELCQRQLGCRRPSILGLLFAVNTLGAVAGAAVSGFYLMPYFGQTRSLIAAALCNGLAAVVAAVLIHRPTEAAATARFDNEPPARRIGMTVEEWTGFGLGLLALGYEMYLFRVNILLWQPLPYTFAATLGLYLLFWSLGAGLSAWLRGRLVLTLAAAALLVAGMPLLYGYQRWEKISPELFAVLGLVYFLPCILFGLLYGRLVTRAARRWGRDVGRFHGFNLFGSCLGILAFTLWGYQIDQDLNAWIISGGLVAIGCFQLAADARKSVATWFWRAALIVPLALVAALLVLGGGRTFTLQSNGVRSYYGRDGVVEIRPDGAMVWDGMEHANLSRQNSHVGRFEWGLAAFPVLCSPEPPREALVIGLGCGVTAATLAKLDSLRQVDVYEINPTLKQVMADYPNGTLGVADNDRIHIMWRDGRTGLALSEKKYDLITQQPLFLRQAGSGALLSREYMELVKRRLKPGGVFCIYAHSFGNEDQSLLVRRTARSVFKYCESFLKGGMIVASDRPLTVEEFDWLQKAAALDELYSEVRFFNAFVRRAPATSGLVPLHEYRDVPRLDWGDEHAAPLITDDHPLVEYPAAARRLISKQ
ncbi:MAG: fused MFS/spermidine synthase [Pirellulaceae bacterium]